jgi:hypothetical protein
VDIVAIFQRAGEHLFWERLADNHIDDGVSGEAIERDDAYFVVRVKELYLGRIRFLWRKYYPLLHAFAEHDGQQDHGVSGPGQLSDLGNVNLDRFIGLNDRLTGPTPYRGGDVAILIGLYSIPGQDVSRALVSTVSGLAALAGPAVGQVAQIAAIVKKGVDDILGLSDTRLRLGVRDSFYPTGNPLRSGYHVGIAAPSREIDTSQLWLRQGRLVSGVDPIAARPYEDRDYMVIAIEKQDRRDDWAGLPGLAELNERFGSIMAGRGSAGTQRAVRLNELWPEFQQTLAASRFLTRPDRERIAGSVQLDLTNRLEAIRRGGPFETRSWGDETVKEREPTQFDLADVPDYVDPADPESARQGREALQSLPAFS